MGSVVLEGDVSYKFVHTLQPCAKVEDNGLLEPHFKPHLKVNLQLFETYSKLDSGVIRHSQSD